MVAPSLTGGNVGNLYIGKGICRFQKAGDVSPTDLGNVTDVTLTADNETLEHFSSRQGIKTKDLVITLSRALTLKFTAEEYTPFNVALQVQGTLNEAAADGPEVEIYGASDISGTFTFEGTNDQGPRMNLTLFNCTINPTGDLGLITDEFGAIEMEANVLPSADAGENLGRTGFIKWTNLPDAS